MRQMSLHKLGLAALAGAAIAGCNFMIYSLEYESADGGIGGGSTSSSSSSSGSSGTGLSGGGGTGGTTPVPGRTLWSKAFGDAANDTVNAVAVGPDNHIYLTGRTSSYHDFGCGAPAPDAASPGTGYLVELNPDGGCVWATYFGADAEGTALAVTDLAVYVAGSFSGNLTIDTNPGIASSGTDAFLAAFGPQTHKLAWLDRLGDVGVGTEQQYIAAITADSTTVTVAGTFVGSLRFEPSASMGADLVPANESDNHDAFVLELASTGLLTHQHILKGMITKEQTAVDVARNSTGVVAFTGMTDGAAWLNGNDLYAGGDTVMYVRAFSESSTWFTRTYGDDQYQTGRRIAIDSNSDVIAGGEFFGVIDLSGNGYDAGPVLSAMPGRDVFVARLKGAGLPNGGTRLGSIHLSGDENISLGGMAIFEGAKKYIIAAGGFLGSIQGAGLEMVSSQGSSDAWVARIEFDLSKGTWIRRFGDGKDQSVTAAAVDSLGNTIIVGHFQSAIDFGDTMSPHNNTGSGNDIFIAKLAP